MFYEKETFIEEGTRYKKHCTYGNDVSVPFKVGTLDLTQFSQSPLAPHCIFVTLTNGLISLPFQK